MNDQIDITEDNGSVYGYIANAKDERLNNYFMNHDVDFCCLGEKNELLSHDIQQNSAIGLLRNLYVEEEHRNQGIGSDLLSQFIDLAFSSGACCCLLVADKHETQNNNFNLQKWYEDFGFELIAESNSGPIMILYPDV